MTSLCMLETVFKEIRRLSFGSGAPQWSGFSLAVRVPSSRQVPVAGSQPSVIRFLIDAAACATALERYTGDSTVWITVYRLY